MPNCSPVMNLSPMVRLQKVAGNAFAALCGGPELVAGGGVATRLGVIPIDGVDQIESRRAT